MKLYEALAEEIADAISTGTVKCGERLASVRQASKSRGVSASTVFEAYYLLEKRGLIQARERSGYFVVVGAKELPPEPEHLTEEDSCCTTVNVSDMVFQILESTRMREIVPLGSAFPSPQLYPWAGLARSMTSSLAKMDPWSTVADLFQGNEELRRQIALRYLVGGLQVPADDIVITNGALEALNLCLLAVTRPGDSVIVESPTFYGALQSLEQMGLQAIEVPAHPRDGLDLRALAIALERYRPKACWLMTNFQNPLGCLMPDEKKRELVALLTRYDTPLIEDDVYGELYFGNNRPRPAKAFDSQGMVMHCGSFSKSLAPGYRIGWTAAGRYSRLVARMKITSSLSTSAPAQAALAEYLRRGGFDRHLKQLRHAFSSQLTSLLEAIAAHFPPGTLATRPAGGYFLWVEVPMPVDMLQIQSLACRLGISIAPGPMFSARHIFNNCMRLNFGHAWTSTTEAAIVELGRLISANAVYAPKVSPP